jgi:hypothetical protein
LNDEATGMQKGFARPGYFFIDPKGIIREKIFEAKYRERLTGNSIIAKLFPELGEEVTETVEAPHLQLALEQSDPTGVPGTRITLAAEVRLPPEVHVYAPGTQGYKPIKLVIDPMPEMELKPAIYPQAGVSGLRRYQVLCASVHSGEVAIGSLSPRSNPSPGGHSTQIDWAAAVA